MGRWPASWPRGRTRPRGVPTRRGGLDSASGLPAPAATASAVETWEAGRASPLPLRALPVAVAAPAART
eukprot:scaffold140186_cov145-Phaeocystis_antarctica.AAC.1